MSSHEKHGRLRSCCSFFSFSLLRSHCCPVFCLVFISSVCFPSFLWLLVSFSFWHCFEKRTEKEKKAGTLPKPPRLRCAGNSTWVTSLAPHTLPSPLTSILAGSSSLRGFVVLITIICALGLLFFLPSSPQMEDSHEIWLRHTWGEIKVGPLDRPTIHKDSILSNRQSFEWDWREDGTTHNRPGKPSLRLSLCLLPRRMGPEMMSVLLEE